MQILKYKFIQSPVGPLKIIVNDESLMAILWENEKPNRVRLDQMVEENNNPLILETEMQLNEYFLNKRKTFTLPMNTPGTPFQQDVWNVLTQIPFGVTWSYKEIASKILRPKAFRAVGNAIGRNPISIIIPCHRVIASDGTLAGFAGGINRKKILLDLESNI